MASQVAQNSPIPEPFASAEMLFGRDRYFRGIDDAIEHLNGVDGLYPEDYPVTLELCKRSYGYVPKSSEVVAMINESPRFSAEIIAENLAEVFLEDLYLNCENDEIDGCVGVEELIDRIALFKGLNQWIFQLFGGYKRFNPGRDVIGIGILNTALEKFEEAQKDHHFVFEPIQPSQTFTLTWGHVSEYSDFIEAL